MSNNAPQVSIEWIMGIAIILVLGIILLGIWITPEPIDETPRVGDTWEFYSTGDPFNNKEKYIREIIDIEGNHIRFIENRKDTLTRVRHVFDENHKLISRKPITIIKDTVPIINNLNDTIK